MQAEDLLFLTQITAKLGHTQADLLGLASFIQQEFITTHIKLQSILLRLGVSFLVLFFLILCILEDQEPKKKIITRTPSGLSDLSEENDLRDEYNFMASKQAIPAKLDLARVYKDMGDTAAAKAALLEVLIHGDKTQIQEARELLGSL